MKATVPPPKACRREQLLFAMDDGADPPEKLERCRRLLAGIPQLTTAKAMFFDRRGEAHARSVAAAEGAAELNWSKVDQGTSAR